MLARITLFAGATLAMALLAATPAAAQDNPLNPRTQPSPSPLPELPRGILGSTSAVPGDRIVCLYDKPTRRMICHTFNQWRAIGLRQSARQNFEAKTIR